MSGKRYFGGASVKGTVRQMTATSWKDLVTNYFNIPVLKKFTRAEFLSYDKDTQDAAKDGPFLTAPNFKAEGVPRKDENCELLQLAFMDFDSLSPKDKANGFVDYAQQFCDAPTIVRDLLHPCNYVMFETISSKKDARRIRIVVDLQPMVPTLHKPVIRHLASLLGVDMKRWKGCGESMVLSQPMFRPVQFQDEEFTAVLGTRTDGLPLEDLDIPHEFETDTPDPTGRSYAYDGDSTDFDMMHLPVVGITIDDVAAMLKHLDADNNYHLWVKVGMALRHQFRGDEDVSRQAFDLFDDWSSEGGGGKYVDRDETYAKWKSFKPDATGRAPTTLRTIFEEAIKHGWDHTVLSKKIKRDLSDWIKKCLDPDELMQRGAAKIAAMPFKNDMVEEALYKAIQGRIAELSDGLSISIATIKKAVRQLRQRKAIDGDSDDMAGWARPWVFVSTQNHFRHMVTGIALNPEAFDNKYSVELMGKDGDSESALTGRPSILPRHYVLNLKKCKRVDGTTYDPRRGEEEPFFEHDGQSFLNEYRVSTIPKLDSENAKKAGKILSLAALRVVGEEHQRLFLDFAAHTVQFPGDLVRWAFLIQSAEGAGKNMLFNAIGHALGKDLANFKSINAKAVLSNFNAWISGAQLIVLDEIKLPGHSKVDLTNGLKDMITNDTVSLEAKGVDLVVVQNVANKAALTNYQDALYLDNNNRRWMPIKSPIQSKSDVAKLHAEGLFDNIAKLYKFGGATRQFLLDWEISSDFPKNGPAPQTAFGREMVLESKNRLQEEIEEFIDDDHHVMIGKDIIFTPSLTGKLTQMQNNHKPSHFLQLLGYERFREGFKAYIGGVRGTIWVHRDRFDDDLGCPLDILAERAEKEEDF